MKNNITKPVKICPVSKKCSGCQLSNLSYEQQLNFKQNKAGKYISKFCAVNNIIGMQYPYNYRNKAQFVLKVNRQKQFVPGIYQSVKQTSVEVDNCFLHSRTANEIIKTLCKLLKSFKVNPFDNRTGKGFLRSIIIREGFSTGEVMVIIVGAKSIFPAKNTFVTALVNAHPQIKTIVVSVNTNTEKLFTGTNFKILYGNGTIIDKLCGLKFLISPKSFYQVNPLQTKVLYNKAIELANLKGDETVLDAYCGIGTISLIAAKKADKVYGVEIVGDAIKDAKRNAKLNNIKNTEFYTADASGFIKELKKENKKIDVAFIDPPRAGCSNEFLETLCSIGPDKIIYISCNVETQARDIKKLMSLGYKATTCQPVDMFPHTNHVETVVLLSHKDIEEHVKLSYEPENKPSTHFRDATYEEIKSWVLERYGFKVSSLYIAQVKDECGLGKRENYNKSKKEDAKVPLCPENKKEAIKAALEHFEMINDWKKMPDID